MIGETPPALAAWSFNFSLISRKQAAEIEAPRR